MDYVTVADRYRKNYITDTQLDRFVTLGIITQAQRDELYAEKYGLPQAVEDGGDEEAEAQEITGQDY